MSADATNADHLENPAGPHRACQALPLASLVHVYVGKGFLLYMKPIKLSFVRSFAFLLFQTFRSPFYTFPFYFSTFPPHHRLHATAFAFAIPFFHLHFPLTHLPHRVLVFTCIYKPSRLASPKKRAIELSLISDHSELPRVDCPPTLGGWSYEILIVGVCTSTPTGSMYVLLVSNVIVFKSVCSVVRLQGSIYLSIIN